MAETALTGMRIVLLEPDAREASRLAQGLAARGAAVEVMDGVRGTIQRLRADAPDAVVLAAPLPGADWIGLAALVKDAPEPPALVVLDGAGAAASLARALPAERGADAVLERGAKIEALAEALQAAAERAGAAPVDDAASLPELLVALRRRGESGVLEVRAEGVCTRIVLRQGAPVFAEGGALRETLGRMLLRRGALSEADYLRVIERMTERLIENETTRMGEVVVELGLLTPAEVFEALSEQVREKIVSCFRWERFSSLFLPSDDLPEELLAYRCPPLETLLLAGLRAHYGPARLEPLLAPHATRRPRLVAPVPELATRFQLTPAEQRLVHGIAGTRTLAELRASASLDAVHAAQVLAALIVAEAVEWDDAPRSVRPDTAAASPAAARPETAPARADAPPAAQASQAVSRPGPAPARPDAPPAAAAEAPRAPSAQRAAAPAQSSAAGPPAAPSHDRPLDPKSAGLEAERAFRQGLALLEQSALPGALRAFGRACALAGDEPEYRMYEAWTELLVARDDGARALARAKAKACAERVLARDRKAVRAHTILGQLAIAGGDLDAAERHFQAALREAREDREALRGLRLVERRRAR